jgi:phage baseplate assembly protein W
MSDVYLGKDMLLKDNDIVFSNNQDLAIVSFRNNLRQAIIDRLKTAKGEYFNKEYGSELHKCMGKPKNELLKNQATGYIVEALKQEPRINSIEDITITFDSIAQDKVNISITVIPIQSQAPLNLIFPFFV